MSHIIPDDKIDEVRAANSILDVVSQYVSLKKAGRNHIGLCPFHSEKTPSFTVNEDKEIFHCFGCGSGGNVFSFLMKVEGRSFPEVVRDLAAKSGIELPEKDDSGTYNAGAAKEDSEKGELKSLCDDAATLYHKLLMRSSEGESARAYLKGRGLDAEVAGKWRIGYGGKGWSAFTDTLNKEDSLELAEKAGLLIKGKKDSHYDRFRKRLIFPISDLGGNVVAFGGRILEGEGPKYVNSPESPVYVKGNILYGLNISRSDIREAGEAIVVEGYMDLLALHSSGIKNVVAALGTALTTSQALLLKRFSSKAVLLFDADSAGLKAAERGLEVLIDCGVSPFVLTLPEGEDPDSFVRNNGAEALIARIKDASPAIDFVIDERLKGGDIKSPSAEAALIRHVAGLIHRIKDPIERKLTMTRVAKRLSVSEDLITQAARSNKRPTADRDKGRQVERRPAEPGKPAQSNWSARPTGTAKSSGTQRAEEMLLALMIEYREILEEALDKEIVKEFTDPDLRVIAAKIEDIYKSGKDVSPSALMDLLKAGNLRERLSVILLNEDRLKEGAPIDMYRDCEKKLRESSRRRLARKVQLMIEDAHARGAEEEVASLTKEKQKINQARKV